MPQGGSNFTIRHVSHRICFRSSFAFLGVAERRRTEGQRNALPNHGARQQNPQRSRTGANRLVKSAHRLTAIPSLASADKDVKPEVEQVEQAGV